MTRIIPILLASVLLTGCERALTGVFDLISGTSRNVVIIKDSPLELTENVIELNSPEPARVVGRSASVCMSLKGDVTTKSQSQIQSIFENALGGAVLEVIAIADNGKFLYFPSRSQNWSMFGKIAESNELSVCMNAKCGDDIPNGTEFSAFQISATKPLKISGIYWESTNAWDNN